MSAVTHADVRRVCERALNEAKAEPQKRQFGAVNWGNLRIAEVLHVEDENGDRQWRVTIEEANSAMLSLWVEERARGELNAIIEVQTEW